MPLPLKTVGFLSGAAALAGLLVLAPSANADIDLWPTLKKQAFGDRAIAVAARYAASTTSTR